MLRSKKLWTTLAVACLAIGCLWLTPSRATGAGSSKGVTCVIDMVVTTGTASSSTQKTYHKEFTLLEGETFSDDFSTATRFGFFDAGLTKANGEWTMAIDWFADTTVFNSVDLSTAVIIPKGVKTAKTVGTHEFSTGVPSPTGSITQVTQTSFSIVCVAN